MPATLLEARRIVRAHGPRTVLEAVDLRVDAESRIALIGPNGSGKSTLLRILAGLERPDAGVVQRRGTVGYLPQLTTVAAAGTARATVRETILERIGVAPAERELDRFAGALARGELDAIEPHAAALERWLALGGADADARLTAAAAEAGLPAALLDRPLATLSGGQAARAGLAALRTVRTDVLLLDEPTNHLDADGLERLAALLDERQGAYVVVSHDRALLARAATQVVELDVEGGAAHAYSGGWDAYEHERDLAREQAAAAHEQALARRAKLAAAAVETDRRSAAMTAHAGRRPLDGDKHGREWVRSRADGVAARAATIRRRAARVEVPDKPWETPPLRLDLTAAERRGTWVVALERALIERGAFRLGPLDVALAHGDRVLLHGPNGSGKSTLIAALAGRQPLTAGRRQVAAGAVVAELGQGRDLLLAAAGRTPAADDGRAGDAASPAGDVRAADACVTLVAAVRQLADLDERQARAALAAFGLGAEHAERPPATLSPGERTRAELAVLAHRRARCLLLDEPTNHLDVGSLETLEAALSSWPGALVVATHDLRLREALGLTREVGL